MSEIKSLCISCGSFKSKPWEACPECGFIPHGEDLVKSVYCSTGRFASDPIRSKAYEEELLNLSSDIRSDIPVSYVLEDLARLRSERDMVADFEPSVWKILLRVYRPLFVVLLVFVAMIILRYCVFAK